MVCHGRVSLLFQNFLQCHDAGACASIDDATSRIVLKHAPELGRLVGFKRNSQEYIRPTKSSDDVHRVFKQ